MLGDDVTIKFVPVILCSEENVVGNHSAINSDFDEDTVFYFASHRVEKHNKKILWRKANKLTT